MKILGLPQRVSQHVCTFAICLVAFGNSVANATTVTVKDGNTNQQIENGGSIYNPASDSGPFFIITVQGASAYIYLSVTFYYTDQYGGGFTYLDTFQVGNGTWNIPFPGLGGQNVVISWSDVCGDGAANMNFVDYGTNPAIADIQSTGALYGYPWFWPLMISHESSNVQYATNTSSTDRAPDGTWYNSNRNVPGLPIWGYPEGIGLTQVDGSRYWQLTYSDYFSYKQNIKDGLGVLFSKKSTAYTYVTDQENNAATQGGPGAPSIEIGAHCGVFGPGDDETSLQDGEWMTYYNGGHLLTWRAATQNVPAAWIIKSKYLNRVCQSTPLF